MSKTGTLTMVGKLADGTAFSASAILVGGSAGNQGVIYVPLSYPSVTTRSAKGLLVGPLTFEKVTGSDLDGTLAWMKPLQSKGAYPAAIDTNLNVIGSLYTPPARGGSVLPGFSMGNLELSDGVASVNDAVTLTTANALVIGAPNTEKLRVTINATSGLFTGSFLYPSQTRATGFGGVLFQDQTNGAGFFLGPHGSGKVTLGP